MAFQKLVACSLLAMAFPTSLVAAEPKSRAEDKRPNILFIVADDLGYADLGFQGGKDIPTPHIDSIAASGTRFSCGYVSGPYCSPTRAGLLTGRYQQRFGHEFNPGGEGGAGALGLPVTETTIADRLKGAGYATGLVGKWHLGSAPQFHPLKRGFQEYFGFLGGAHTYFDLEKADVYRNNELLHEPGYLTDAFGREAVSFIEKHKQEPFFLYLAFNAVHTPMEAPEDRIAEFDSIGDKSRRTYAAMLSSMDQAIGKVLKAVEANGLDENTLIVFISDNGGPTMKGTTINASSNAPLRGSKRTTLEGGIRVPFVIRWKGQVPAGKVHDNPVIQLDLQPTALAAAGVDVSPDWKLDGVNLLPYLTGKSEGKPHETLYWRLGDQNAVRHGDWKLVSYDLNAEGISGKGVSEPRLYDLSHDVGESENLATSNPEKVQELTRLWKAWDSQLATPLWGPRSTAR